MIGTLLAALTAFLFWITGSFLNIFFVISVALIVFTIFALTPALALTPIQRLEEKLTPRLIESIRRDPVLQGSWLWVLLFVLASLFISSSQVTSPFVTMGWVVALGFTLDLYGHYLGRHLNYLNPFVILQRFADQAKSAIQNDNDTDLCNQIDAIAEVGVKSLQRSSLSLTYEAIDQLQKTTRLFLRASKSISHHQKVSFLLFFTFQRLEMIQARAVEARLEPVISAIISTLGKIALAAAESDLTLLAFPFQLMGKFALEAQKKGLPEIGVRTTCTFLEVNKRILSEVDLSYGELKEPYFTLVSQMEDIVKEMFRQNKKIDFRALTQPFVDLREQFLQDKVARHQDAAIIVKDIERVLDEFTNLEAVLKTVPPPVKTG